jgi:hypothetical protein
MTITHLGGMAVGFRGHVLDGHHGREDAAMPPGSFLKTTEVVDWRFWRLGMYMFFSGIGGFFGVK